MNIHNNFWSEGVLSTLSEKISDYRKNNLPLMLQANRWGQEIIRDSAPVLIYSLPNDEFEPLVKDVSKIYDIKTFDRFWAHLYFWQRGSYIPWHMDGDYKFVGSTYLNDFDWDYNWGGAGLYKNEDGNISAHFPTYNTLVAQYGDGNCSQYHATTILSPSAPVRITLQTFGI